VAHEQAIMTMTYGSLGGGILSGAFRVLPNFDEKDIRYTFYPYFKEPLFSKIQGLLDDMDVIAARHDVPLSHIALACTAQKGFVTTALVGSGTVRSARENCRAFELDLTAEEMRFLDDSIDRNVSA
jgi:aryl-alcohol dehydrogenase-like predicted oxidoreductase